MEVNPHAALHFCRGRNVCCLKMVPRLMRQRAGINYAILEQSNCGAFKAGKLFEFFFDRAMTPSK
jgi:hypothetical protein